MEKEDDVILRKISNELVQLKKTLETCANSHQELLSEVSLLMSLVYNIINRDKIRIISEGD